jgi:hypothetical protein
MCEEKERDYNRYTQEDKSHFILDDMDIVMWLLQLGCYLGLFFILLYVVFLIIAVR